MMREGEKEKSNVQGECFAERRELNNICDTPGIKPRTAALASPQASTFKLVLKNS